MTGGPWGRGDAPPARRSARAGRVRPAGALALATCLSLAGCGGGTATPAVPSGSAGAGPSGSPAVPASPRSSAGAPSALGPVVVDTDLDADDLRALIVLAARPDVDLRAVTVAGTGIVHCPVGVAIARAALARVGRPDVPVACGRTTPLAGSAAFPDAWRARADAAKGLDVTGFGAAIAPTAVDLLGQAIEASPARVHLIVLGPATNVAEALVAHPDLKDGIGAVTMMGGALHAAGNVAPSGVPGANDVAEWNVFADPTAWQAVLDAGLRPTIVPLDATNAVPVSQEALLVLGANRDAVSARLVFDLFDAEPSLAMSEQSFWDSLTAVAVLDPSVVTTRAATVRVVVNRGAELGRLVEDPAGAAATVATSADPARFEAAFVSTLNGGAPVRPVPSPTVELAVSFDGTTCRAVLPPTMPTGYLSLELDNRGPSVAGAVLFLLDPDATVDDVLAVARSGDSGRLAAFGRVAAAAFADPGATVAMVGMATRPGRAIVMCFGSDPTTAVVSSASLEVTP